MIVMAKTFHRIGPKIITNKYGKNISLSKSQLFNMSVVW